MSLPPDSSVEELSKATIVALAASGPFGRGEAADALTAAGVDADVDVVLALLEARQVVIKLGGEPNRWELVID